MKINMARYIKYKKKTEINQGFICLFRTWFLDISASKPVWDLGTINMEVLIEVCL